MALYRFQTHSPKLGERVFVADQSVVLGQIEVGDDASIWPYVAARGDVHHIKIGARSNIQDNAVLHVTHDGPYSPGGSPLHIGADVTIGHGVILHACTIDDACLIGMGAVVLDRARIGKHCMLGAGSVLAPDKVMPPGSLWVGNPARYVRDLSATEIDMLYYSARNYVKLKDAFLSGAVERIR